MNCDFIASAYRHLEHARFGRLLERCRFAHLPKLSGVRRALLMGEGDGRFVEQLARMHPNIGGSIVECSSRMLELCQSRLHAVASSTPERFTFHNADAFSSEFARGSFDLVVTHFFFDVFSTEELELLIAHVEPALSRDAMWLVSDFDIPPSWLPREAARFWIRIMYLFFRYTTGLQNQQLPKWRDALRNAGFAPRSRVAFRSGFVVSELWQRR